MTENENEIEEIEDDSEPEGVVEESEVAVEQANKMHQRMNAMKEWASRAAGSLEGKAELARELDIITEDEEETVKENARRVRTVMQRVDR